MKRDQHPAPRPEDFLALPPWLMPPPQPEPAYLRYKPWHAESVQNITDPKGMGWSALWSDIRTYLVPRP